MPIPFGYGVGDFVAVGALAWNIYKSCKGAPESFSNISAETLSLHALLKEVEETLFIRPLPAERQSRLKTILDSCKDVLTDLQNFITRYHSLGIQAKRTRDRMKWGNEDVAEIRGRLVSNITLPCAFISTSQISVEQKLDMFIEDFRQGRMEGSIISVQTVDSLSANHKVVWRTIRKELEDIGVDIAAFEVNRDFIFEWFVQAVETGAFEEQKGQCRQQRNDNSDDVAYGQDTQAQSERDDQIQPTAQRSGATRADIACLNVTAPHTSLPARAAPIASGKNTCVPRIAALIAGISRPKRQLLNAIDMQETAKAFENLNNEASSRLLDQKTLNAALCSASRRGNGKLVEELLERGADLNTGTRASAPFSALPLKPEEFSMPVLCYDAQDKYGSASAESMLLPRNYSPCS